MWIDHTHQEPNMVEVEWTAQLIRALRLALRMSPPEFACLVGVKPRTLALWENGQTRQIQAANRRQLDDVLTGADPRVAEKFMRSVNGSAWSAEVLAKSGEVNELRRRDLLAGIGAGMAGQLAELITSEPDRMLSVLDSTSVSERRLTEFECGVEQMGRRVVQEPPQRLVHGVLADFASVRTCLQQRHTTAHQIRLVRVAGRLANVMGEILFNQGHFAAAQRWYKTAIYAAEDIGDRYSGDIALAGLSYLPTYSADPQGVLDVLGSRLGELPDRGPAVAWLWGMAARAHATLGDANRFSDCITRAAESLERSSGDEIQLGIFSFRPEKLTFYEAIGHSRLGNADAAADASRRAIALYDPKETTEPALVQLEYATALLTAGEVEEACTVAARAVKADNTFLGATVTGRAREFDHALGGVKCQAVSTWRHEVLPALESA